MKAKIIRLLKTMFYFGLASNLYFFRHKLDIIVDNETNSHSALDELIKIPLFNKTLPTALIIFLMFFFMFYIIKMAETIYSVDASKFSENLFKIYFIISVILSMLVTLNKEQFEFLGSTISFILIFIHFFPKDFTNSIKQIDSTKTKKLSKSHKNTEIFKD